MHQYLENRQKLENTNQVNRPVHYFHDMFIRRETGQSVGVMFSQKS
jgi:hypothetical protein